MAQQFNKGTTSESAVRVAPVTPSDTAPLPNGRCRALWVGTAGDLDVVVVVEDGPVLHKNVPEGVFPVEVYAVKDDRTTAEDIVAWY